MAFHQEDFSALAKGVPDESLRLEPNCHPGSPVVAVYDLAHHVVVLACSVCRMGVVDVHVAARPARGRRTATAPTPTTVQRMDVAARRNRARRKK